MYRTIYRMAGAARNHVIDPSRERSGFFFTRTAGRRNSTPPPSRPVMPDSLEGFVTHPFGHA
jgi:hypothetical protein